MGAFSKPKLDRAIEKGVQPTAVRITEDGVHFRAPLTGKELFIGPKESMAIQGKLGADIIFAFDECTPPRVTHNQSVAFSSGGSALPLGL